MQKRQNMLIAIAAIAALLAICASAIAIAAMTKVGALEQRIAALEAVPAPDNGFIPQPGMPDAQVGSDRCSLTLGEWEWDNDALVLHSGFARVQAGEAELREAVLELCADGKALEGTLLAMVPGEASDTMEADLAAVTFQPETSALVGTVDLRFTAKLANGDTLTAVVGGWSYEGGSLMLISG